MDLSATLLRRQHGCYAAGQARALGIPRSASGHLPGTLVLPRVRSLLALPLPREARYAASLLYAGPDARLTGVTAAAVLGWLWQPADATVQVSIPAARSVRSTGFAAISRTRLPSTVERCGFPLAGLDSVLVNCAATLEDRELTAVLATATQRREVLASWLLIAPALRRGVPGVTRLRRALAVVAPGTESVTEVDCLHAFARWELPAPACQVEIWHERKLVTVADFWWRGVAGFYDGAAH